MAAPLLEIEALVAGYNQGVVINRLSLSLAAGEVLGIFGRNGVGKTTLLKTVMGLLPAKSGSIKFDAAEITGAAPYDVAARGIGYVPQGREIFGDFSVRDNLRLGNLQAKDFNEIYELFPVLRERQTQRAGGFSGGQQQQLAIGRALAGNPKLLLLDEPSEGLQPSIVAEIATVLRAIAARRGMTIVLVEQNVDMVLSLCSRCVFVEGGAIVEDRGVDELRSRPDIIDQYLTL